LQENYNENLSFILAAKKKRDRQTDRQKRKHKIIVAADFMVCGRKTKRQPRRAREQGK
jgi:hypothetical protein